MGTFRVACFETSRGIIKQRQTLDRQAKAEAKAIVARAAHHALLSEPRSHLPGKPLLPLVKLLVRHDDFELRVGEVAALWHKRDGPRPCVKGGSHHSGPVDVRRRTIFFGGLW